MQDGEGPASSSQLKQQTTYGWHHSQHNNANSRDVGAGCDERVIGRLYGWCFKNPIRSETLGVLLHLECPSTPGLVGPSRLCNRGHDFRFSMQCYGLLCCAFLSCFRHTFFGHHATYLIPTQRGSHCNGPHDSNSAYLSSFFSWRWLLAMFLLSRMFVYASRRCEAGK
jgi:hypothetical protein